MKTQWLAFMAGIIWLAAGFNVCRIGVEAWRALTATTAGMVLGSLATLVLFSVMFVKMLFKNVRSIGRIYRKPENTKKTSAEEKTWSITQTETAISVGMEGN